MHARALKRIMPNRFSFSPPMIKMSMEMSTTGGAKTKRLKITYYPEKFVALLDLFAFNINYVGRDWECGISLQIGFHSFGQSHFYLVLIT